MERVGVSLKLNRATGKKLVARGANLLTAKPDMTRWYLVGSDGPLGKRSDRMCVSMAGRNLEINDHRKDRQPTVRAFLFEQAKALAECKRISHAVRNCSDHAEFLERMRKRFDERIAVQGITDKNGLMTIVANPGVRRTGGVLGDKNFRLLSTTRTGATAISLSGGKFNFSKWIVIVLNQQNIN